MFQANKKDHKDAQIADLKDKLASGKGTSKEAAGWTQSGAVSRLLMQVMKPKPRVAWERQPENRQEFAPTDLLAKSYPIA